MNSFKRVSDLTLDQAEKITERMHNAAYDVSDLPTSPTVLESVSALLVRLEFFRATFKKSRKMLKRIWSWLTSPTKDVILMSAYLDEVEMKALMSENFKQLMKDKDISNSLHTAFLQGDIIWVGECAIIPVRRKESEDTYIVLEIVKGD